MCRQASDICIHQRLQQLSQCESFVHVYSSTHIQNLTDISDIVGTLSCKEESINYGSLRWEGYRQLGTDEKLHQIEQCVEGYRAKRRLATRTCPVLVSQSSVSSVESGSRTIPMPCGTGNETDYLTAGIQAQVPQEAQKFLHVCRGFRVWRGRRRGILMGPRWFSWVGYQKWSEWEHF